MLICGSGSKTGINSNPVVLRSLYPKAVAQSFGKQIMLQPRNHNHIHQAGPAAWSYIAEIPLHSKRSQDASGEESRNSALLPNTLHLSPCCSSQLSMHTACLPTADGHPPLTRDRKEERGGEGRCGISPRSVWVPCVLACRSAQADGRARRYHCVVAVTFWGAILTFVPLGIAKALPPSQISIPRTSALLFDSPCVLSPRQSEGVGC